MNPLPEIPYSKGFQLLSYLGYVEVCTGLGHFSRSVKLELTKKLVQHIFT